MNEDTNILSVENIKELFQKVTQNRNQCGFEAYIVTKTEPKLRKMVLSEKEDNYKKKVRDHILAVIKETYLNEEAEFSEGINISDNQRKNYIITQDEGYHPFDFLQDNISNASQFIFDQIDDVLGIAFWFRNDNKEFWAYQHSWSTMVPNKKKNNLLARVMRYEKYDCFEEQKDPLLTIASRVDLLVIDNRIITSNISLLQKCFGFQEFIVASANKSIDRVKQLNLVSNPEKLYDYIKRKEKTGKYAKKMMRISNSKVLSLTKEELMKKVHSVDRWKNKFEEDENGNIVLNTYVQVESLIDLFDERYTRSEITGAEYDTDVKQIAEPVNQKL